MKKLLKVQEEGRELLKLRAEIATPSWVDTKRLKRATPTKLRQYKAGAAIAGKAGLAAAAIPYGIYKTAKEVYDLAEPMKKAMDEGSEILTNAPNYMAKHGETVAKASGAFTSGSFLTKPETATVGIGYKSLQKGLRKDITRFRAEMPKLIEKYPKQKEDILTESAEIVKKFGDISRAYKKVSPKTYRNIKQVNLKYNPNDKALATYYMRQPGPQYTTPQISHNLAEIPKDSWAQTVYHEIEHNLHNVEEFPTAINKAINHLEKKLRLLPDAQRYSESVKEQIAESVSAKIVAELSKGKGQRVSKGTWDKIAAKIREDIVSLHMKKSSKGVWSDKTYRELFDDAFNRGAVE